MLIYEKKSGVSRDVEMAFTMLTAPTFARCKKNKLRGEYRNEGSKHLECCRDSPTMSF